MQNWVLPFIITISYTVITIVLGIKAKGKLDMNQSSNWGVSGNTMGGLVVFFLLGSGQISAYTFMGAPGWAFSKGVAVLYVSVYLALMNYMNYLVNPRIVNLSINKKIKTQAEAFGIRYESKAVRALGAFVGSLALIAYAVLQIVGCGYVLYIMSGQNIPIWLGELIVLLAIFSYVYTSGLRAIGWTNVMQGILMFIMSFVVGITLSVKFTGQASFGGVFERVLEMSPEHLTLPGALGDFGPVFWSTSILITMISVWPSFWISASGGKSIESVRNATAKVPIYQLVMIPMMVVGFIAIFAMPDFTGKADHVALTLGLDQLHWIIIGLLGAGTLAAAQSSSEPLFQALAYTWTHDVFAPYLNWSEEKEGKVQRYMLIPFMFGIVLPLSIINPAQLVYILLIGYGFLGQIFPLVLGLFVWPRSTKYGAVAGMLVGVVIVALFSFVWPHPMGIHAGIWGIIVNAIIHIIVSLMTKPESKETMETFFPKYILDELYVEK